MPFCRSSKTSRTDCTTTTFRYAEKKKKRKRKSSFRSSCSFCFETKGKRIKRDSRNCFWETARLGVNARTMHAYARDETTPSKRGPFRGRPLLQLSISEAKIGVDWMHRYTGMRQYELQAILRVNLNGGREGTRQRVNRRMLYGLVNCSMCRFLSFSLHRRSYFKG